MNDSILNTLTVANNAFISGRKHPLMKLEIRNYKTITTTDLLGFIKGKYGEKAFITRNEKSLFHEYVVIDDAGRMDATVSSLVVVA